MPAFIDELSTWNRAEPTTKKRNKPRTQGPTGIFSSLFYRHNEGLVNQKRKREIAIFGIICKFGNKLRLTLDDEKSPDLPTFDSY